MKKLIILLFFSFTLFSLYAQNPEWINYNTSNSGLPGNDIYCLAIDGSGNKWIGTYHGGLAKFDGTDWTVYNISNSGLPNNTVYSLAIDGSGNKWIGTYCGGLAKFDGTNWTGYNESNSGLPVNFSVTSIAIDENGNKWVGAYSGGFTKFDGTNWTVYNISNSGLPTNSVTSLAIDESGNTWIGTYDGLVKFDGTNWTVYDTTNSGLPDGWVNSLAIDGSGNKWIGTYGGGLAVYKEGGVVSVEENKNNISPTDFLLSQNYPNPFNPSTIISWQSPIGSHQTIKVYDVLGNEVAMLVDEYKQAGRYEVEFNAASLPSGVYFYRLQAGDFVQTRKMILLK